MHSITLGVTATKQRNRSFHKCVSEHFDFSTKRIQNDEFIYKAANVTVQKFLIASLYKITNILSEYELKLKIVGTPDFKIQFDHLRRLLNSRLQNNNKATVCIRNEFAADVLKCNDGGMACMFRLVFTNRILQTC